MDTVFALDIGTRVVIGLVMQKSEIGYEVIASSRAEHSLRAMYDGQVHAVDEVARIVIKVKKELEQKTGKQLKRVAVAAAGRALFTETAKASREETYPIRWERPDVLSLEMEAVHQAMTKICSAEMNNDYFYCVGYSTMKQLLEDLPITSLVGQRGKKAELTVIATFLPRTVVNGLVAVLERAELEMASLTLEPIAAGQAAIPADMRRLNLALVDIGAGTADIALTKDGFLFSYGMVPIAGDEVTEPICAHYLLDFQEGERVKRDLSNKEEIEIVDFFGERAAVAKREIIDIIKPTIKTMAEKISQEILLLNSNIKPQAVILVGGGSQTPLLSDFIAQVLELPRNRIGIQVRERLINVCGEEEELTGSDVVTPIGIGMSALDGYGMHYYSVRINEMNAPLFELQLATVAEALLAAGIQPRTFLGRPGAALIYEINGDIRIIKGELGHPAQITVNGQPAELDQQLNPDDNVKFMPGHSGLDAKAQIRDVISLSPSKRISWNGVAEEFSPEVYLNGQLAPNEDWLKDGCKLLVKDNKTLYDLLRAKGIDIAKFTGKIIAISGKPRELEPELEVRLNGKIIIDDCILQNDDRIEVRERNATVRDLSIKAEPMSFTVNKEEFLFPSSEERVTFKGRVLSPDDIVEDGMELSVEGFLRKPILSELFPYLNITEKAKSFPGGKLVMMVNENEAKFTTELNQGDRITISWETDDEKFPILQSG